MCRQYVSIKISQYLLGYICDTIPVFLFTRNAFLFLLTKEDIPLLSDDVVFVHHHLLDVVVEFFSCLSSRHIT